MKEKTIARIKKLQALAERGVGGDRPAVIVKSLELREQQNVSADTEKLKRERDLYKDLYERLSNEILGK